MYKTSNKNVQNKVLYIFLLRFITDKPIFTNFIEHLCIFMYYCVKGGKKYDQMVQCKGS